jgi:hypothetical protein
VLNESITLRDEIRDAVERVLVRTRSWNSGNASVKQANVDPPMKELDADRIKRAEALAAKLARQRVAGVGSALHFMSDQEWSLEFTNLKNLVRLRHAGEYSQTVKKERRVIDEEVAAEAGFLLGLEIGRLLGGAR